MSTTSRKIEVVAISSEYYIEQPVVVFKMFPTIHKVSQLLHVKHKTAPSCPRTFEYDKNTYETIFKKVFHG